MLYPFFFVLALVLILFRAILKYLICSKTRSENAYITIGNSRWKQRLLKGWSKVWALKIRQISKATIELIPVNYS